MNPTMAKVLEIPKQKNERGKGSIRRHGKHWQIAYYDAQGRRRWESHSTEPKAQKALRTKLALKDVGKLDPADSRITIGALAELYLADRKGTSPKSHEWLQSVWQKHLQPFFGGFMVSRITTEKMVEYRNTRIEKASPTTINKELTILRAIFYHGFNGYTPPKVNRLPKFPAKLMEPSPRTGFVNDEQYDALQAACSHQWLRALLAVAYTYGFRKSELVGRVQRDQPGMLVNQIDLKSRTIRLHARETKNNEGRVVKMTQDVYDFLRVCVEGKSSEDAVFTWENGRPVKDFRGAWTQMTKDAGVPSLLLHDLRRSAARNLLRAGINRDVAKRITGHKTDSMFSRYNIVDEGDLAEAADKIEQRRATEINGAKSAAGSQDGGRMVAS